MNAGSFLTEFTRWRAQFSRRRQFDPSDRFAGRMPLLGGAEYLATKRCLIWSCWRGMKLKEVVAANALENYGGVAMAIKRHYSKLARDGAETAWMNNMLQMLNVTMRH